MFAMVSLTVMTFAFAMLPAMKTSFECERDYNSPNLELIVEPKLILKTNFRNVTVKCRIAPYREDRLVAYSWLKVTRNRTEIKKVVKYQMKEGPYNLTLSLSRDDFGNVTTLVTVCQGTMLSGGCRNITKVITLLDQLPVEHRPDEGGKSLTMQQVIAIAVGSISLVIGILIVLMIWYKYHKLKKPPDAILDPLTECESVSD